MTEYVPSLTERKKWLDNKKDVKIGDIVLIVDNNSPRGKWPVGRIIDLFPGNDGVVCSVRVKTSSSVYTRPVVKLCLLEETNVFN